MTTIDPLRRDRSHAVKLAIRAAATSLFTTQGFAATGIRDIAAEAGVNPAIVIRHFGSKEQLFLETLDAVDPMREIISGPLEGLGFRVATLITTGRETGLHIYGTIVRASESPDIRRRLQESIIASLAEPLVDRIELPDARLRAHLFAAQLSGLMSALVVYEDPYLFKTPTEQIVLIYGASMQNILTGA